MITVEEALQLVQAQARNFGTEQVDLLQATGRVLAEDIIADRNYPPFNRVTMDGIAIHSNAFAEGERLFTIAGVQAAGQAQQHLTDINSCLEVMTGAVLPIGCDVVIPYEQCEINQGKAKVLVEQVKAFQNVHLEGTDSKAADLLLKAGQIITPAIIGLMAAAGVSKASVYRMPTVAVCATGDELVEVEEQPLPHQIRQSNSYMLVAALQAEGIPARRFHLTDDQSYMAIQLSTITQNFDVILLSGAVSKGKFDFLPTVLADLGLQTIFHGITQKPGKPFLFGKLKNEVLIFGFPGNPVSTFVCYQLYFKSWLYTSVRKPQPTQKAFLSEPVNFKPALTHHLLVTLNNEDGKLIASPISTSTSGDLVNLALTQGILSLPLNKQEFGTDEAFPLLIV